MTRIAIIDDHPVVREGLAAVFEDESDIAVVAAAGSAEELLAIAVGTAPDVVLLDLELPGMSGVDALGRLAVTLPSARVIVFTAFDADESIAGALRAGARGYLLKGAPAAEIVRAVASIFNPKSLPERSRNSADGAPPAISPYASARSCAMWAPAFPTNRSPTG